MVYNCTMDTLTYIKHFKNSSPLWRQMEQTVEASPWHREANVAVHTEMVLEQYMKRFYHLRTERQNRVALLALLAHDFGKPAAEETLEKKDGSGTYRRYAGHEQDSAIAFTECWLQDQHLRSIVSVDEARQIRWIIEHHLPYGFKDGKKRSDLRTAIERTLREDVDTFYDCLRSDAAGRISDDHETKLTNVEDWIREFRTVPATMTRRNARMGTCYVLIGPSGSGKSTWTKQHRQACDFTLSLDDARIEFWARSNSGGEWIDRKDIYRQAWQHAVDNEGEFKAYWQQQVADVFRNAQIAQSSVFIDNTNGSKKARAQYTQAGRSIGMKIVAVEFWNTFDTLSGRQKTRPDKEVPASSLKQQYFAQTCAWLGSEVDEVIIVPGC